MMRSNKGFTLVEILIVVIILGILAAIVIPQFTEASNEATQSSFNSDLQTARSQIELYKVQHMDRTPAIKADGTADTDGAAFVSRLTSRTLRTGEVNASGTLGPYLQQFPRNPYAPTGKERLVVIAATAPTDATNAGWWFDTSVNQLKGWTGTAWQ